MKKFIKLFSGLLTKKFVNLIHADKDGILDLNKVAVTLEVSSESDIHSPSLMVYKDLFINVFIILLIFSSD